jgi:hypothetical protein
MKLMLIPALLLAFFTSNANAASLLEPDDSQTPACYVGNVKEALAQLTTSDLYSPVYSAQESYIYDDQAAGVKNVILGVRVDAQGQRSGLVIPPCGF